jgi:hypothetical protein
VVEFGPFDLSQPVEHHRRKHRPLGSSGAAPVTPAA